MGRLSTSTVLTTCSASLRTSLPRLWGRWARTWKGPPPARQHPTPPGAREAEAPLGLCPETPSSPSVSVFHPPCAQGCQGPLCSKGPLCFRSQCSQPSQALRHLYPAPPTLPGAEAPSTLRPQPISQALARTPGRAPHECGQPGHRPPTSGPLCWPHPGANASGSRSTAGSQHTQVSPSLQPASQPSCL